MNYYIIATRSDNGLLYLTYKGNWKGSCTIISDNDDATVICNDLQDALDCAEMHDALVCALDDELTPVLI